MRGLPLVTLALAVADRDIRALLSACSDSGPLRRLHKRERASRVTTFPVRHARLDQRESLACLVPPVHQDRNRAADGLTPPQPLALLAPLRCSSLARFPSRDETRDSARHRTRSVRRRSEHPRERSERGSPRRVSEAKEPRLFTHVLVRGVPAASAASEETLRTKRWLVKSFLPRPAND